ncbi:hypothetical protein DYB25_002222 [Aphanomyces astaci]|uniref:Methyltransferase type 11 domain-containing protein n=1 Tax=Aphanomyces astaci TaxID=112090 RepID=A0A396ZTK2_APHAT|nr:hypothetical protein DYB25_002222 [Aphanomyces astaci]RHZ12732.1 hypothetical protein DYB31_001225 [Aphanomyces astaci]
MGWTYVAMKRTQKNNIAALADSKEFEYLREEVAKRLVDRLQDIDRDFPSALDLGAGSGHVFKSLAQDAGLGGITHLVQMEAAERLLLRDADTDEDKQLVANCTVVPALPTVDTDYITVEYPNAFSVMEHLRGMGENHAPFAPSSGHVSRDVLLATAAIYQAMFGNEDGSVPVTFQVIYFIGWSPHQSQQKPKARGSATVSLKDLPTVHHSCQRKWRYAIRRPCSETLFAAISRWLAASKLDLPRIPKLTGTSMAKAVTSGGGGGVVQPSSSAPAAMYRPTNKHYQHVVDVVRTSSTSFIALTPTNVVADKQPIRSKLAPASMRSQSLPASSAERSKISPKNSFISSMDIEDWFIAPTYVCSMHSTKDGLTGTYIPRTYLQTLSLTVCVESYRQALLPKDEVIQVVVKQIKHPSYSYITPLTFVISLHHMTHEFKMDYSDYRKFVRAMVATPVFQAPIRNLYVSKMLEDSFVGAVRRALGSVEYLSKELAVALNDLVQLPQLAAHPSFLKLCHIDSFRAIYEVLVHGSSDTGTWELPAAHRKDAPTPVPIDDDDDEGDNSSNSTEPTSLDGSHDCLCALFAYATTLFASHIARDAVAPAAPPVDDIPHHLHPQSNDGTTADALPSVEKVLCLDLMQSRSLLVYYTDTLYTLDKSQFNAGHQYQKCIVSGFGCKVLFHIARVTKTEWTLVDVRRPKTPLLSLRLQKQSGHKPTVAMYRSLVRGQECIGVLHKDRRGYEFQLLGELLTQGKITTSMSIVSALLNHKYRHNILCSVAGGGKPRKEDSVTTNGGASTGSAAASPSLLTTGAISVPQVNMSKQRLHVSDGADVLLHLGLSASFDILMSARPLFQRSEYIY